MKLITILLLSFPLISYAVGLTGKAIPTRVDIERGNGFMVYGSFGNVDGCSVADRFYVQNGHPQYKEIYSTVLAAFMAGKKIQAYIDGCNPVTWYSAPTTTYNTVTPSSTLYLTN